MAYGFKRARLRYAYRLLRGRDFDSEVYSDALREERFEALKEVIDQVLDTNVWHEFIKCVEAAGSCRVLSFLRKTLWYTPMQCS